MAVCGMIDMTSNSSGSRNVFINLAVRDLKRSMDFSASLGFAFNPQFTDDKRPA